MFNQYTYKSMGAVNRHMQSLGETVTDINNIFTTGYKSKDTKFHETMNGIKGNTRRDLTDGVAKVTNRELDFAIQGKGYFEIQMPDGSYAYTRDGSFTVGPNGELLSAQGYPVVTSRPEAEFINKNYDEINGEAEAYDVGVNSGAAFIPAGSAVAMEPDGTLKTEDGTLIGKLNIVDFTNPDGLKDVGDNVYMATAASGDVVDVEIGLMNNQTEIKQGALETSNVSLVRNMSTMVQLNTIIKAEMKVIKILDQMQENLNSTITRNV
jgi:flagellar basal-body rod protein FlgG